jgi:hypothetical protein
MATGATRKPQDMLLTTTTNCPMGDRSAGDTNNDRGSRTLQGWVRASPTTPSVPDEFAVAFDQMKGRRPMRSRRPMMVVRPAYLRLAIAVRSNLPATTKEEPHQLEPKPPGLIGVTLFVNRAVLSLVKALQSPLFMSVS